jgi:hypothetical protein
LTCARLDWGCGTLVVLGAGGLMADVELLLDQLQTFDQPHLA